MRRSLRLPGFWILVSIFTHRATPNGVTQVSDLFCWLGLRRRSSEMTTENDPGKRSDSQVSELCGADWMIVLFVM